MNQTGIPFDIREYVKIYDVFDKKFCKKTIEDISSDQKWETHTYYNYSKDESFSNEDDLDVLLNDSEYTKHIMDKLWNVIYNYLHSDMISKNIDYVREWNGYTHLRYNRYNVGTRMRLHCDHIHSIFDGKIKGVPWLTLLGCLNKDYEGGELVLFKSMEYKLKVGQVLVFPSTFMYPHEVLPVTKGIRYSFVSWVW